MRSGKTKAASPPPLFLALSLDAISVGRRGGRQGRGRMDSPSERAPFRTRASWPLGLPPSASVAPLPSSFLDPHATHTPLETWFWFQWTLTIPYDQGWWEHWFKLYLRWFHCKNLDLYFSTDLKRVLWKYKIIRQMIAFYYIFGFFGTFYDGWSHFCGIKIQFLT